MLVRVKVKK